MKKTILIGMIILVIILLISAFLIFADNPPSPKPTVHTTAIRVNKDSGITTAEIGYRCKDCDTIEINKRV